MKTRSLAMIASALAAAGIGGCGAKSDLGPPTLILGQQECEECRMIISEERSAAAVAFEQDGGITKHAFDDIGCLIDWLRKHGGDANRIAYVHDYDTARWLSAADAIFIHSETLQTPMASHLAACGDEAAAGLLQDRVRGERRSWAELNHN